MKIQNSTFRTTVFKWTHQLAASTGKRFAVCLAKAWAVYRLRKRMEAEIVQIAYEKADGTLKKANATLQNTSSFIKGTGKPNFKTVAYFDTDVQAFRCFKIENFITAY